MKMPKHTYLGQMTGWTHTDLRTMIQYNDSA